MKLKYLLPVATIASVAAVVAPLVTSCASGIPGSWDFKKSKYTSKIDVYKCDEPITEQEATQIYYDKLSKEHGLFNDDMFVYLSDGLLSQTGVTINKAKVEVNASNIQLIEKEAPGETEKSKMINVTMNVIYDIDISSPKAQGQNGGMVWTFTATIKNFKMWIEQAIFSSEERVFGFRPVISGAQQGDQIAFLKGDNEWSITSSGKIDDKSVDFTDINGNNIQEHLEDIGSLTNILRSVSCSSHYLSEMQLKNN